MSTVDGFPQRYQPGYVSIYPDRPVYRAAETYRKIYPYTEGLLGALYTTGNAATKLKAGSDNLVSALAMQQMMKLYRVGVHKVYERFPALAEFKNNHPILGGIPTTVLGLGVALGSYIGGGKLWQRIRERFLDRAIDRGTEKAASTGIGQTFGKLWKPFEGFMRKPIVAYGLIGGMLAFLGLLIFRTLQDDWRFGKQYRAAREHEAYANVDPYTLRAAVAQGRTQSLNYLG